MNLRKVGVTEEKAPKSMYKFLQTFVWSQICARVRKNPKYPVKNNRWMLARRFQLLTMTAELGVKPIKLLTKTKISVIQKKALSSRIRILNATFKLMNNLWGILDNNSHHEWCYSHLWLGGNLNCTNGPRFAISPISSTLREASPVLTRMIILSETTLFLTL